MTNVPFLMGGNRVLRMFVPVLAIALATASCAQMEYLSVSKDTRELWQRADGGNAESQYAMGLRYTNGLGVTQHYGEAVNWFRKAASQGHSEAGYMLGMAHYAGRGIPRNHVIAVTWLQKAAQQGHIRAMYQLGDAFANGRGVDTDLAWAARWYGKAAMRGHLRAQYAFGVAFAAGQGMPVNMVEGWKWMRIAENGGHEDAAMVRAAIAKRLSAAMLARARRKAAAWREKNPAHYADAPTVLFAQLALSRLGYRPGTADGIAGSATRRAIRSYRLKAGLGAGKQITPELVNRLRDDLSERAIAEAP